MGFRGQWAASGESGGKRLEAEQREFLNELQSSGLEMAPAAKAATEAETVRLVLEMRAHRGSNKRIS